MAEDQDLARVHALRVMGAFGDLGFPPRVEYRDPIDFPAHPQAAACFAYSPNTRAKDVVLLNRPVFDALPVDQQTWALGEEYAHYFHSIINAGLFNEGHALYVAPFDPAKGNRRFLEVGNLLECIARLGASHTGSRPSDFGQTVSAYNGIMARSMASNPMQFNYELKASEGFRRDVLAVASRVWGTAIADRFLQVHGIPTPAFLQDAAKARTFRELAGKMITHTDGHRGVGYEADRIYEKYFFPKSA